MSEKHTDPEKNSGGERDDERFKIGDEEFHLDDLKLPGEPKRVDNKKPPEDKESTSRNLRQMVVASQFAYTLVAATFILGWIGNWIGKQLGGQPWTWILMFIFGGLGFVAEMYRMYKMFSPTNKDADKSDTDKKNDKDDSEKS